jgi:hypothetical protein
MVWARCGRCGVVLEDTVGYWKDMPEMIEAAVYDGLSETDREAKVAGESGEQRTPNSPRTFLFMTVDLPLRR